MPVDPYSALAVGYDEVMDHVDYDAWAAYVHALLQSHGSELRHIVELGGGTGSLAVRLQPLGDYEYTLTDQSTAMLKQANEKIAASEASIPCIQADFTTVNRNTLKLQTPVDAVVLVYDGLNYLLEPSKVEALFRRVHHLLRPGGLAVIDQSTTVNSEEEEFVDEGVVDGFSYVREDDYDPETRRHETIFHLTMDGRSVTERHVQRAYTMQEVRTLLDAQPLVVEAAYHGFTSNQAHEESERIHWVLRRTDQTTSDSDLHQ